MERRYQLGLCQCSLIGIAPASSTDTIRITGQLIGGVIGEPHDTIAAAVAVIAVAALTDAEAVNAAVTATVTVVAAAEVAAADAANTVALRATATFVVVAGTLDVVVAAKVAAAVKVVFFYCHCH